jgi:hypothetical protein
VLSFHNLITGGPSCSCPISAEVQNFRGGRNRALPLTAIHIQPFTLPHFYGITGNASIARSARQIVLGGVRSKFLCLRCAGRPVRQRCNSAPYDDTLHSHYAIALLACQLPPISREKPCFANSNEIALRNSSCHELANVFAIAHHGRLLRYLLHVSVTTRATLYRIINFLINTKLVG